MCGKERKIKLSLGRNLAGRVFGALLLALTLCLSSAEGQSGRRGLKERGAAEATTTAAAAEGQGAGAEGEDDVLRVKTEEVLLPVSVRRILQRF